VGRAGLVAACLLVQAGMPADAATDLVRATRHPSALENAAQVLFLHDFEDRLTRR
jgi:protein-tyrosine phosphatase